MRRVAEARTHRRLMQALAMVIAAGLGGIPAAALAAPQDKAAAQDKSAGVPEHLFGEYLAGRDAQQHRDFSAAAGWFEKVIAADADSPEIISRTFLMEVSVGHFERALALAPKELKLDPSDAIAEMVLLIDRLKAGDAAGAAKYAAALPSDGVHRFIGPFALAWTRMAAGDLAGADTALQGLDKFNGFQPLKVFQLALLYDFAKQPDKAQQYYDKALASSEQLNWRLTDAVANFDQRHGRAEQAKALYQKFLQQNAGSELASAALTRPAGTPQPLVRSPADGLAEAMFDLASVLNQAETVDLSLIYVRFALDLRPQFGLAQLLLADVLSAQNKPEESLAVLAEIKPNSPYYLSARLRGALNLDTLDRTEEAINQLKSIAAEQPQSIAAEVQLGDILRNKKRYAEAVTAYDEAIQRASAAGMPERWTFFYDRGVALERSGQWERAEQDLKHALELKPEQPLVLNYLGYSWIDRGEHLDEGLKMIEKAVELRPDDGYIVDSLGWAHYRMGDYEGAVEQLEKAIELVPQDPTINDHLGDAYWQSGRLSEARYQWQRALQFGPQESDVKPIEEKLQSGLKTPPPSSPHGG
ncbi:MAG: tetratricopeptide repeat protein [Alphaproteobacteria bacterium]|nr:tetratricopeptide repeat protein [Alphaproteobacteria bacterium]